MSEGLLAAVTQFLYDEAQLLDERRFEEWLALFAPDGYYWMPITASDTQRKQRAALIDDNRPELELRVRRLLQPAAHTELPPPSACRCISNIVIEDHDDGSGNLLVRSKLVMHEYRQRDVGGDDYRLFCGTVRHGLTSVNDTFRIGFKRVDLFDSEAAQTLMPTPV